MIDFGFDVDALAAAGVDLALGALAVGCFDSFDSAAVVVVAVVAGCEGVGVGGEASAFVSAVVVAVCAGMAVEPALGSTAPSVNGAASVPLTT